MNQECIYLLLGVLQHIFFHPQLINVNIIMIVHQLNSLLCRPVKEIEVLLNT